MARPDRWPRDRSKLSAASGVDPWCSGIWRWQVRKQTSEDRSFSRYSSWVNRVLLGLTKAINNKTGEIAILSVALLLFWANQRHCRRCGRGNYSELSTRPTALLRGATQAEKRLPSIRQPATASLNRSSTPASCSLSTQHSLTITRASPVNHISVQHNVGADPQ